MKLNNLTRTRMEEAARVSKFMDDEEQGRWRIRGFTVTDEDYRQKILRLKFSGDDEALMDMQATRAVPPGTYVTLARRMIPVEVEDAWFDNFGRYMSEFPADFVERMFPESKRWIPVMSDTPSEINEHAPAFENAHGRVLITGLGLGCLPHALLRKPGIERIDIIEIDPDVIALTGKYLTDPRVHIWQGSAADPSCVPADLRWDYAWHDIWSHISAKNLVDESAEHRISYGKLFAIWDDRIDPSSPVELPLQDAWAFPQALTMKRLDEEARMAERKFRDELLSAPRDEAIAMLYERVLRDRVSGASITDEIWAEIGPDVTRTLDPEGHLLDHLRQQWDSEEFQAKIRTPIVDEAKNRLGLPNEHLEANAS